MNDLTYSIDLPQEIGRWW